MSVQVQALTKHVNLRAVPRFQASDAALLILPSVRTPLTDE